jgi:hypothetical protein
LAHKHQQEEKKATSAQMSLLQIKEESAREIREQRERIAQVGHVPAGA